MRETNQFPGLIPDSIDLSSYLDPEESVSVRPASFFKERTLDVLNGRNQAAGLCLPWAKTEGKIALRAGELSVWVGYKGHGKSMLLSQVLLHAMRCDERVLIVSPEFRPEGILARKARQAACTSAPADGYVDSFFAWATGRLWLFDHQGSLKPDTVLAVIRYAIEQHGVTQVLVDSLMKCGMAPDDYPKQKRFVDDLQSIAHQAEIHLHLVAHARKSDDDGKPARLHDIKGASELADMAENVFSVWKHKAKIEAQSRNSDKFNDEPDAMLIVDSQRNGDGWTGAFNLWFHRQSFRFVEHESITPSPIEFADVSDLVEF